MTETPESRIKRIRMRSWRRGIKEMDIVLGPWADAHLESLDNATLDAFEALLDENDQDLLSWILGQSETPAAHRDLLDRIATHARARISPGA